MSVSWMNLLYGIAALVAFSLLKGVSKPKFMPYVVAALAAVTGIFFARATPVVWIMERVGDFLDWVGTLFGAGQVGAIIAGIGVLALVIIIIRDLFFSKKADGGTFNALLGVSLLAVIAAGPIAEGVTSVGDAVQANGAGGIARSIGG